MRVDDRLSSLISFEKSAMSCELMPFLKLIVRLQVGIFAPQVYEEFGGVICLWLPSATSKRNAFGTFSP